MFCSGKAGQKRILKMGLGFGSLVVLMLVTGCDTTNYDSNSKGDEKLDLRQLIESMVMTPIPSREAGDQPEYVLEMTLKRVPEIQYPEIINMMGFSEKMPSSLLYDDGSGPDNLPGDLVYTAIVPEACSPIVLPEEKAAKDIVTVKITCSGDFIRPGEECEGYGVCPEQASRSFLWGLIEYDTNVSVCWCGFACDFDIEFKVGL